MDVHNQEYHVNPDNSLKSSGSKSIQADSTCFVNEKLDRSGIDYYFQFRNQKPYNTQVFNGTTLEIDDKYTIIEHVAYNIFAATDNSASQDEEKVVAIKKMERVFEHKYSMKKNLLELKMLRMFKHENVIDIKSLFLPPSRENFKDVYSCSTLMETDLAAIIRSQQPLSDQHCQFFVYQILRGLKYIHSAGVIHFALRPINILINNNFDLRISNFYQAKFSHIKDKLLEDDPDFLKWSMPPEILLDEPNVNPAVDVWSAGCILAELINRRPLFTGVDYITQLNSIFDVFGTPTEDYISTVSKPNIQKYLKSLPSKQPKELETLFPKDTNPLVIDLISKMLTLDWKKRITVEEALQHPYLKDLHLSHDEPVRDLLPAVEFDYEGYNLSTEQWRNLFYEEMLLYNFKDFKEEHDKKVKEGQSTSERARGNAAKIAIDDSD